MWGMSGAHMSTDHPPTGTDPAEPTSTPRRNPVAAVAAIAVLAVILAGSLAWTFSLQRNLSDTQEALTAAQTAASQQAASIAELKDGLASAAATAAEVKKSAMLLSQEQKSSEREAAAQAPFQPPADLDTFIQKIRESTVTIFCGNVEGSGWAIDLALSDSLTRDGYKTALITNNHVITDCTYEGARGVTIEGQSGESSGYVWSWDEDNDLAMVLMRNDLPTLQTGERPAVGAWVLALGSPLGIQGTATTGRITNMSDDYLLTDAAINHGNSGGPLVNSQGNVVGINTSKAEGADNTGLAVGLPLLCDRVINCDQRYWN